MLRALPIWLRRASIAAEAAICAIGLLIVLTLPAPRPHLFINHFRAPDVGRQAQQHSFVDQSVNLACEQIAACCRSCEIGKILLEPNAGLRADFLGDAEIAPPTRLFLRLKLGSPGRPSPDPLV